MQLLKPTKFPHVPPYAYTRLGFDRRVRKRLRRDGFTVCEVRKLRQLYFSDGNSPHQDERGVYRNKRKYHLHQLSRREMKFDRKSPLFQLVLRSGLFYVFCDDHGNVTGFSSPRTIVRIGAMPFFT